MNCQFFGKIHNIKNNQQKTTTVFVWRKMKLNLYQEIDNVFYFVPFFESLFQTLFKSLILAQDERWRRG